MPGSHETVFSGHRLLFYWYDVEGVGDGPFLKSAPGLSFPCTNTRTEVECRILITLSFNVFYHKYFFILRVKAHPKNEK